MVLALLFWDAFFLESFPLDYGIGMLLTILCHKDDLIAFAQRAAWLTDLADLTKDLPPRVVVS